MPPESAAAAIAPSLGDISRDEILRRLNDQSLIIVDVLPTPSYQEHHIPGSISLPVADVEAHAHVLLPDPAAEIALYCAKFT